LKRPTPDKEVFEQLIMKSKHDQFIKIRKYHDDQCPFVIQHYASDVNYSMAGMIMKNKDFVCIIFDYACKE
jgi:myosin heavy subunit